MVCGSFTPIYTDLHSPKWPTLTYTHLHWRTPAPFSIRLNTYPLLTRSPNTSFILQNLSLPNPNSLHTPHTLTPSHTPHSPTPNTLLILALSHTGTITHVSNTLCVMLIINLCSAHCTLYIVHSLTYCYSLIHTLTYERNISIDLW